MATLMGVQEPRIKVAPNPAGYTTHDASDAVAYAAFYKLVADPWQENTCEAWMRRTKEGRWCASTWAITVSRQNGKNGALEIVELYGMAVLGLKFLHTAHEVKTARKAFLRIKYFFGEKSNDPNAKFPELNALVKEVRNTNGQEAIVLHAPDCEREARCSCRGGGSVEFIARSKGSGRGFTVDVLVLDEAQDLTDDQLEALLPTISAAPSGDPVTIFMGTPPGEIGDQGEPFVRARNGALLGTDKRVAWVEFSAEGDVDKMDAEELHRFVRNRKNWAVSNPAAGRRINEDTILAELALFSDRSFARERLNCWPEPGKQLSVISKAEWNDRKIDNPSVAWPLAAIGVDMNPEMTKVTITMAVFADEPLVHLEVAADTPFDEEGTTALVEWLWVRARRRVPVVIDAYSPARILEPHLKKKRMRCFILGPAEFAQACMGLYRAAAKDKSVTHIGQSHLDESVDGAVKESMGKAGQWKFNRVSLLVDLGPVISAACALFGAVKFGKRRSVPVEDEPKRGAFVV